MCTEQSRMGLDALGSTGFCRAKARHGKDGQWIVKERIRTELR